MFYDIINLEIIDDRFFWIYFVITLFFIIIGVGLIIESNDPHKILISIIWLLSNILLLIIIFILNIEYSRDNINSYVWIFINFIFISLLIISTIWAGELGNNNSGPIKTMSGILIILGIIILFYYFNNISIYMLNFWIIIAYFSIWLGLTLYVI